jgi:putative flippase GtrA
LKWLSMTAEDHKRPFLSVIVPVFNEEGSIAGFWLTMRPILHNLGVSWEIVFVDVRSHGAGARDLVSQIARFGAVGICATLTSYLVALLAASLVSPFLANGLGYLGGVGVSYFGHRRFTFRSTRRHASAFPRFAVASLCGLAASYAALAVALARGLPTWTALLVSVGVVPLVSFLVMRAWVFKATGSRSAEVP